MALGYIHGAGGRVVWRDVLRFVVVEGETTTRKVADHFKIMPQDALKRLTRLRDWGMVKILGGARGRTFIATDYGTEVAQTPIERVPEESTEKESTLEDAYPDLESLSGIIKGPVALMRVAEVDYADFEQRGIEALPSRVTLDEDQIACEKKFDGWLCQVAGGRLWSRRGKELSQNFLFLTKELRRFNIAESHLVGELIYRQPDGRQDEKIVTSIAMTADPIEANAKLKTLPGKFEIVFFDLIGHNGKDISKAPFAKRHELLESVLSETDNIKLSPIWDFDQWRKVFQAALDEGGEGVVLKNRKAPYIWRPLGEREARPAGTMWKVKAIRSDDFIVFDARVSEKDRLIVRFGQIWKGEIVEVGEVNNLSRETEQEFVRLLKKGPFVVELGFQERFPKPPGRLRNPVFLRLRPDKPIESATLPVEFAPE